jgi:hypothetical protein
MVNIEEKSPHASRKRRGKGIIYSTLQILPSGKTILSEPYLLGFYFPTLLKEGKYPTTAPSSHLPNLLGGNKTEKHFRSSQSKGLGSPKHRDFTIGL